MCFCFGLVFDVYMRVLGNTVSFKRLCLTWIIWVMDCYMNVHIDKLLYECSCWLIWCYIMLLIEWWLIMDCIVESLLCCCCRCRWCCQVVEVVRWWCISCWVHAYSCKVGGSCPVECLIIQTTLILRAYALHVDLGVDAPHVVLRAIALHVEMRAYALTRWLVPHAYCIVMLLLCRCIVVNVELSSSLLSCCRWFELLSRNKWSICELLLIISICELLLLLIIVV